MPRRDGRKAQELRPFTLKKNFTKHADGSVLVSAGETQVVCTAMCEPGVPSFLKGSGSGWVTAEYGMLPGSCPSRIRRNTASGRVKEIQRLIGRSLRAVTDTALLGENTVKIDCDVLQADGGTRTASITGAFVALALACRNMQRRGLIARMPLTDSIAAVSVGISGKAVLLDLNYEEDSTADVDMNVVMVGKGRLVEVQGTAEGRTFSRADLDRMLTSAGRGIRQLIAIQQKALKGIAL
ncbi:MAG: ribonuclease PH [Candidatus Omnitrophota bacterium]